MSYNGSGTFNINSAGQPVVTGTVISSTAFNALTADLGTGLSTALTKDGQTVATARIPFAAGINSSLVTDATSTTTGSIITAGGVGVAKALFVGTTANIAGATTLAGVTATTGAFTTVSATTTASSAAVTINGTNATGGTFFLVQRSGVAKSYFGSSISISGVGTANDTDIYAVGDGRLFGGDQTTNFTKFTSTGLAVTGTLSATGNATIGAASGVKSLTVSSSDNNASVIIAAGNGATGGLRFNNYAGTQHWNIYETEGAAGQQGNLSIYNEVAAATQLVLDSSGNLLVGLTSAPAGSGTTVSNATASTWTFRAQNSTASFPVGIIVSYTVATPNNGGQQFLYCEDATAIRAAFASNGGLVNYSANNSNLSDRREKTNFSPATSYLAKICAIPVQTFNYIDQNMEEDGGLTLGVVAQDVQAVAPELVMESNWASKDDEPKMRLSIYQTDLQYALMKCIQEQQTIITALTTRITALEAK